VSTSENAIKVAYLISDSGRITVHIREGGYATSYSVANDHLNYTEIRDRLRSKNHDGLEALLNVRRSIETKFGDVVVKDNEVLYKGRSLHGCIVDKILSTIRQGDDPENLIKFLGNLMENPSKRSVDSLFEFLQRYEFTIDEDGYFIAYKSVRTSLFDWHSNSIENRVGSVIEMERNMVSDDITQTCHYGLHVGALDYAQNFSKRFQNNQPFTLVVCKVHPRDVCACPQDYNHSKLRTCKYQVIAQYTGTVPDGN
jgi:hypothetical protein